ncbi:magnesium transporter MRS2-4 [Forsythia ovata]|uniref:Magnesium transporter MRS2-4 n=1 Tax=Forsythia ovata TaxID=205694 RepID=A0ABD1QMZ4_9LAMI
MRKGQLEFRWRKGGATPLTPPPVIEVVDKSISAKDNRLTYGKKKTAGTKLWMIMDRRGQSELMECDNSVIIKRVSVPARDLRILGPEFAQSSSILGSSNFTSFRLPCFILYRCDPNPSTL